MKTLILIRHAEAESAYFGVEDKNRELTQQGYAQALHMSQKVKSGSYVPDIIFFSDAVRTQITTQVLQETLDIPEEATFEEGSFYDANVGRLLDFINQRSDEADCFAIVGHNPTLSFLAEYLTGEALASLAPADALVITFDFPSWSMVSQATGQSLCRYTGN
ncbi:histidine phosphatase family protein [Flammeovirga yaeyamensis]|uniref:Histidine phosphatase family protein n=1 Tax=Flammeovirga yaeyamensis TaxID=367791 RepID=A0AAX1N775_9BACT|nr:histidine phosphatase family protein [Flammeovirga yaeyamensis]MBB3697917.1 phosphohistidine phosphatase [Flammeovirga yaeyamensis]NMF35728.1 hypothetical protein [Flammeovirga yaeyamensis]QWG03319.1 histidine phosphatase family protein [Flammeovirga yaeyamensis]